jgi:hypothetical protein
LEGYGFGKTDWDFAAGGELCDSAGTAGCPRERIAVGTEIGTYEFMNVPQIHITYETQNIKFADAVMGYWGLNEGLTTVYTYDEKDFKKIPGLQVHKP